MRRDAYIQARLERMRAADEEAERQAEENASSRLAEERRKREEAEDALAQITRDQREVSAEEQIRRDAWDDLSQKDVPLCVFDTCIALSMHTFMAGRQASLTMERTANASEDQ